MVGVDACLRGAEHPARPVGPYQMRQLPAQGDGVLNELILVIEDEPVGAQDGRRAYGLARALTCPA